MTVAFKTRCPCEGGFTLMEVLIGILLSTLVISGIVQLVASSASAYQLQLSQSEMEASSRYAREVLMTHIEPAGFQPEPWNSANVLPALTSESKDGNAFAGDQLGLQRWSQRDCFGNENPVTDAIGRPEFYLLNTRFHVNTSANLALTCRYGPNATSLRTQINNFGLAQHIESMQVLYAQDIDGDHTVDGWVTAGLWQQENTIRAVKIALLLSSRQPFALSTGTQLTLLDKTMTIPADGRLRRVDSITVAIRGRL